MTIGNRIARLRKEKGFTQEYLAEQLGVSRQAVSKWEQDQTSPDTKNLIALSQLLDTSIEYIATGKLPAVAENSPTVEQINQKISDGNKRLLFGAILLMVSLFLGVFTFVPGVVLLILGIVNLSEASKMSAQRNKTKSQISEET